MSIVTRGEKEFLISLEEFRNKSHYLDSLLIQDEHNAVDGYIIRSLYFDTVYDDDFFEKLEGVETAEQNSLVSSSDCDYIQGWYYSKALPLEECESFISSKSYN